MARDGKKLKNVDMWLSTYFTVDLAITVSALNVLHLRLIIEWWNTKSIRPPIFQFVRSPYYMSYEAVEHTKILKELDNLTNINITKVKMMFENHKYNGYNNMLQKYLKELEEIYNI